MQFSLKRDLVPVWTSRPILCKDLQHEQLLLSDLVNEKNIERMKRDLPRANEITVFLQVLSTAETEAQSALKLPQND